MLIITLTALRRNRIQADEVLTNTRRRSGGSSLSAHRSACARLRRTSLKGTEVKDIQGNEKGKGKNNNLWRYRALRNGLYVFKHEYVMLFRKDNRTSG